MKIQERKQNRIIFKKFKTYSSSDIIAAGGTALFAQLTGHNPKKMYHLSGERLSEQEFEAALIDLKRK